MKRISLIHLGIGNVGQEVVRQVLKQQDYLSQKLHLDLRYTGLFNSKGGIFRKSGLSDQDLSGFPYRSNKHIEDVINEIDTSYILIDTTASDQTLPILLEALKKSGFIVLANKKPLSDSYGQYNQLLKLGRERILFETTVGAGLPIMSTLKTLLYTGDEIVSIEGCFSGTLGLIFSSLEDGLSFSQAIRLAKEKGFTEPDPRDDLSGLDVARKTLILARIIGMNLELSDIKLQKLFPPNLENISVEEFMSRVSSLDENYKEKMTKAKKNGNTLRFVASISQDKCSVGLKEVEESSDIGSLKGPDNIISIKTKRYFDHPLVIKGPGAGPEVTAAGVFGDILLAAQYI